MGLIGRHLTLADFPHRPQAGRDHQDAQDCDPEAGRTSSNDERDVENGDRGQRGDGVGGPRVQVVTVQCAFSTRVTPK